MGVAASFDPQHDRATPSAQHSHNLSVGFRSAKTLGDMHIEWRLPPTLIRPLAAGSLAIVVAAAVIWWLSAPVQQTTVAARLVRSAPSPAMQSVMVDVVGDVKRPGVVRLPSGARVVDAVAAAGGLLPRHRPIVNMARLVIDGEQIVIGESANGLATSVGSASAVEAGRVNLNQASATQLDALPGIGPVLAQRIVEYRAAHGSFAHTRDLLDVPGIGDAKFTNLSDAVTVS
jgi:competence protein ComEA